MTDITVSEAWRWVGGDTQFIDVREDFEVADGMIPGARHISLSTLSARLGEIDRTRPAIAVCRSGNRSAQATDILWAAGFRVDNMGGGMLAWQQAGLPMDR